ncbi:HAD family hydrolase [Pseudomonas gingeri]|uniref:HAD family hydrolase n=1 Tax=Pseudomonas gingeri TaxID=117681 RepID=A0A7Y7WLN3_9PSED|nr:HAD family hydrolase [Pseudomonas gingeri]MBV6749690.1 HAD family hydrolase [Pseudomonas chlororaphis]NWB83500.1 HAD family hydrolase [Pseudomonas gingeri]
MVEGQRFAAFLFDMDGTLLNSIASAERVWAQWAERHGLDVEAFLQTIHGVRSIETVRRQNLPGVDPEREAAAITQAEIDDVEGVIAIEGAKAFLASLPPERWAIVTSAPRALAERRMAAAGLDFPPLVITAEDIAHGKPAPDCYLLAAQRLGVRPQDCLVFEDAPAGITAGETAEARVVVISATHAHPMETPHRVLADYRQVAVHINDQGLALVQA